MHRTPVISSNLRSVGYDSIAMVLEVEFHGGRVYRYRGVPEHRYVSLMAASSRGSYFAAYIKNVYPHRRIR